MDDSPFHHLAAQLLAGHRCGAGLAWGRVADLAAAAVDEPAAADALYTVLVEGLCDEFSRRGHWRAARVLCQALAAVRRHSAGAALDQWLAGLGYGDHRPLLARLARLVARRGPDRGPEPAAVCFLSRVTIGADVMILSVLVQAVRQRYPAAELLFVDPGHLAQIFGGLSNSRFLPFAYRRRGSMVERVTAGHRAAMLLARERAMAGGRLVLVDPDSRLSQLGLQPVAPAPDTWYFPSRLAGGAEDNLAALAGGWAGQRTGLLHCPRVRVWPDASRRCQAAAFLAGLTPPVLLVNFGSGGNPAKALPAAVETRLVLRLLEVWPGTVVLDSGKGEEGLGRVAAVLDAAAAGGHRVGFCRQGAVGPAGRLIGLRADIGFVAALLAGCHGFLGYDSSCQHLAAAQHTRGLVLFAGAPNRRFLARWRPADPDGRLVVRPVAAWEMDLHHRANLVEEVAFFFRRLAGGSS